MRIRMTVMTKSLRALGLSLGLGAMVSAGALASAAPAAAQVHQAEGRAATSGMAVSPGALAPGARAQLEQAIAAHRQARPDVFRQVAEAVSLAAELDRRKRGPFAPMKRLFKSFGPAAVLPMLELLAFDGPAQGGLTDTAWRSVRSGMIEAIGTHRDDRAEPVMTAILTDGDTAPGLVRSATEALGKLGTDTAAATLTGLVAHDPARRVEALQGMGYCRRVACTETVVAALAAVPDADLRTAKTLVRALGDAGNAMSWTFASVSWSGEGDAVRAMAAEALVTAFTRFGSDVRSSASNALMVVDAPSTPALVAQAVGRAKAAGDLELVADLAALDARFAANPTRRTLQRR